MLDRDQEETTMRLIHKETVNTQFGTMSESSTFLQGNERATRQGKNNHNKLENGKS